MPSSHRRYRDWTRERIQREAAAIGDDTAALVEIALRSRPHPEQGFRSCIGILGLRKRYGMERLDVACARALTLGTRSYGSVAAILKNAQSVYANKSLTAAGFVSRAGVRGWRSSQSRCARPRGRARGRTRR
jgi:transposase